MKTQVKLISIVAFSLPSFSVSQDSGGSELPQAVLNNFRLMYPNVPVKEWEWGKEEMLYEVEFITDGKKHEAYFTREGKWIRTEKEIKKSELPQAVMDSLEHSEFSGWKIDEAEELQLSENQLIYEIEVEQGEQEYDLYFQPDGTLVETISKK